MTEPDGPTVEPTVPEPSHDPLVLDPLLPPARPRAEQPDTDAPAPDLGTAAGSLGGWFDSIELDAPSETTTLRRSATIAPRSTTSRRSRANNAARAQVYVIAALAALLAAWAPGRPTGLAAWDLVLRMALAFVVTVACSHARRWTWMVLSGVAAAASRDLAPVVLAWTALGLSFAAAIFDFRRRRVGAIVGALAINAVLRIHPFGFHGLSALLAAAVILPVLISAYRVQRPRVRKRILIASWSVAGLALVAVLMLGVAGLLGVGRVASATSSAKDGLDYAKAGKQDESAVQFTMANDDFEAAEGLFKGWFVQPSRLVPIVGYQTDALGRMAAIGHDLAGTAERVTTQADYRRVTSTDGRIDVAEIRAWGPPLAEVEAALLDADAKSDEISTDWLVSAIQERYVDLDQQVADAIDETSVARDAVAVAPDLLGANGVRRYFIAFTTPAESRGLGGFMGNWAILEANDGHLELTRNGRSADLVRRGGEPERTLDAPQDYITRYGPLDPQSQPRDITLSPDFPSVAQAITSVYPQTVDGTPIDGVLAMDPYALAAMLEITGPVKVAGLPDKLSSENAADYLLRQQYLTFDPADLNAERKDVLEDASKTTFKAFISQKTFRPSQLAEVFGPVVAERRLVAYANQPAEEALVDRLGLDGTFPKATDGDFLSLVTQNAGNNKMDIYLKRKIAYDVVVDPQTGALDATATITLHNDAPSSGLPAYVIANRASSGQPDGVNWMWFNFYTPHLLDSATWNGQPMSVGEQSEFGRRVYQTYLPVPSGGDAVIVLQLHGTIAPAAVYDLDWFQQPLVNTDEVSVTVRATDPGQPPGPDGQPATTQPVTITTEERTDQHVSAALAAST